MEAIMISSPSVPMFDNRLDFVRREILIFCAPAVPPLILMPAFLLPDARAA